MKSSLAQTHAVLKTKAGREVILFREVISSSKVEGISCAERVLNERYEVEKSAGMRTLKKRLVKKALHKLKV